MPNGRKRKADGPFERIAARSYQDFRRLFDDIFSSAGEGHMTLEVLKGISETLLRFFRCRAVEIVCEEKGKLLHAKALSGRLPSVSGWREKDPGDRTFFDVIETAPAEMVNRLKSEELLNPGHKKFVFMFPGGRLSPRKRPVEESIRHVFLLLPSGRSFAGIVALSFPKVRRADDTSRDLLTRLANIIGLSLTHNLSRFELRERVKELTCMYNIANLAVSSDRREDHFLQQAVELLPPAYLYPGITQARIVLDAKTFRTPGFRESPHSQRAEIVAGDLKRGVVEVVYLEPRPELDEGPFLAEERRLLDSVAREIALIIGRRQAEVEQARLQDQLRHADRLATIGKLAAGVAHELNEPLTGILGFAELLKELPGMPPQAASDLGRIESSALHAREVVRKLLLFARQITPKQGKVCVNRLVQEVVGFFQARLRQQGIKVQTQFDGALPDILADESQVRQIIMNLCINAIHAMEEGGILTIATQARAEEVVLSLRDTGPGIPEDIKDKIFLPFFTTKDVDVGTGLGLSVVHGIVKSHRGRIKVVSEAGRGAEFKVYLPVKREQSL
jgi:signal transduction histidine kinase